MVTMNTACSILTKDLCLAALITLFLLLAGDIEENPGPKAKITYVVRQVSDLKITISRNNTARKIVRKIQEEAICGTANINSGRICQRSC